MPEASSPWLCEACKDTIVDGSVARHGRYDEQWWKASFQPHHKSLEDLMDAASAGCFVCSHSLHKGSELDRKKCIGSEWLLRDTGSGSYQVEIHLIIRGQTHGPESSFALLKTRASEQLSQIAAKSRANVFTGHPDVAELASHWLRQCLSGHEGCQSNLTPKWYPRRVLDISQDEVLLVETQLRRPDQPYATMSHCWGGEKFTVLTDHTIDEFRRGRPLSEFPRSFRDVITTARRLEIQYIWIDCFCIMQTQGSEDQLLDLASMDQVYANALINFGATSASKPSQGCFVERATGEVYYRFQWKPTPDHEREEYFMLNRSIYDWADDQFYQQNLFTRAWVLQERLLCARMLHLTDKGVYWECNGVLFADELLPCGSPQTSSSRLYPNPFSLQLHGATIVAATSPRDKFVQQRSSWGRIRSAYSSMQLSFPEKDKFVALAGIARQMALEMGDEDYIAGTFGRDLGSNLYWLRDPGVNGGRAKLWRAPSWSWASVDGKCLFRYLSGTAIAEFLEWRADLVDPNNKYGAILSASLSVRGKLVQATWSPGERRSSRDILRILDGEEVLAAFDDDNENRDRICLLPLDLDTSPSPLHVHNYGGYLSGLVLGAHRHQYQRLGTFTFSPLHQDAIERVLALVDQAISLV